jgi:hypothetical protein
MGIISERGRNSPSCGVLPSSFESSSTEPGSRPSRALFSSMSSPSHGRDSSVGAPSMTKANARGSLQLLGNIDAERVKTLVHWRRHHRASAGMSEQERGQYDINTKYKIAALQTTTNKISGANSRWSSIGTTPVVVNNSALWKAPASHNEARRFVLVPNGSLAESVRARCIAMVSRALTGELHLASRTKTLFAGERTFLASH